MHSSKVDESDEMIEKETRRINREKENALQKCELISPGFKRQAKKRVRQEEEDDEVGETVASRLSTNYKTPTRNQPATTGETVSDKRRRGRVPELRVGDLVTVKYNQIEMDAYIIKYSKGKYDVRYVETKKIQRNFPKKYLFAK